GLSTRLLTEPEREAAAFIPAPAPPPDLVDDISRIEEGDRVLLIVENELGFARILLDMAHQVGLKALSASRGDAAVALARRFRPAAATLDLRLPDMTGAQVLQTLRNNAETRDIPVHVISGVTDRQDEILTLGAASYWVKPVDPGALTELFRQVR